ncbi:MAG: DNA cytosine methyltransferase [Candidatus Nitrospinota bacterium M3_3B_026]
MMISCVDMFCGAGGLTNGLRRAGINVVAGFDVDSACHFPYTENNETAFYEQDITKTPPGLIKKLLSGSDITMLAGCPPCQPFSSYTRTARPDESWGLLYHFGNIISEVKPDVVSMENVPGIARHAVFSDFLKLLERHKYQWTYTERLFCPDYGIPQNRTRLVLLAIRHGKPPELKPSHPPEKYCTVRDAIGNLEPLEAGTASSSDPLHATAGLSELNLKRIRASKSGGTWRDWPQDLIAACHKRNSGKTYPGVYGRMEWDIPSPTITTQYFGFGNGRFGHPEQDRGLSLREGSILQSFPRK